MYDFPVTTPANTTEANPTRTELLLDVGVIDQVEVAFPPGPQGLLHVRILRGASVLWPRNGGEGYAWDDDTLRFNPLYVLEEAPLALEAVSWNDDDTYDHQVTLRFNVVPAEVAFPPRAADSLVERLGDVLLGRRRRRS